MNSQQRRKFRRAVERAAKDSQGSKQDKPKEEPIQHAIRKTEWLAFSPATVGILLTILLGIPTLLGLRAHPTVSLDVPLNPHNVLSTPVIISNDGLLDLDVIELSSYIVLAEYTHGISEYDDLSRTIQFSKIEIGEKETVAFSTLVGHTSIKDADIALIVSFHPQYMPFWRKTRAFRFHTALDSEGNLRFEPIPSGDVLKRYARLQAHFTRPK